MKTVALRDFQQKGVKAVPASPDELVLLQSRSGPAYFLVPVQKDNLAMQSAELERAMAVVNLHSWQQRAAELKLQDMSLKDIQQEVSSVRKNKR